MDETNDDRIVAMDATGTVPPGNVVALAFRRERERPVVSLPLTRPSVLIVEDSAAAADATGLLLRAAGARVRWADSLGAANRHLRSFAPETVIVDPGLPDGCGFDLVARLRQLGTARPRIIVVSGDDTADGRASLAGADMFMAKPVPAAALLREIVADRASQPLRLSVAAASAPSLIADLQRARLDVLRAALSGEAAAMAYPVQFLTSLAIGGGLNELKRLLIRLERGLDTPRDLAAGLARMIDAQAAREVPVRA